MAQYYIAYQYSENLEMEMIDGPYGTAVEAEFERNSLLNGKEDAKLKIVRKIVEVTEI